MKWHSIWFKSLPEQGSWIAHLSLLFYHAYEAGMVQEATEIGISLANLYLKEEQYGELTKLLRKLEQLPKKNKIFQFHLSIFDLHLAMKTNQIQEIKRKFHHIDRLASSIKDKREIIDFWLLKARYSLKFESRSLAQDMILEAQHRVKRWKDEEAQGSLSYLKGCIYYQLGQYKHADKHLEEAFNYYLIHEEPLHFYRIAHDFYQLNMDEHDFKKAIKIAEVVIDYSNTKGYAYSKAAWQIKLAAGFYRIEEYKPAEDMLEKAKRYFKVFYVMHKWTTIQSLYSDLLIATGDLDKARLTLENAIDSLRFYEDPKLYLRLNIKYAEVLLKLGQVQRLHQTVDCILKHARSINEYCYFVEGYLILANLYITLGLYSRAKEFVLQASEASKQGTGRHIIALERQYLGLIYNFLGDTEKGYKELKRGLATAETVDDQSLYFTSLYSLARFYISTNAWEEARGIIDKLSNIPSQKSDTSHLSHMDAEIEYLKIFFYFSRYVANRDPKDIEASVSILRRLSSGYSSLGKTSVFDMKLNLLGFHTYESRGDTDMALNYLNNAYKQANAILDENKNDRLQSVLREPQSFIGRVLTLYRKYNQPEEVKQPKPYPKREDKKRQDEKAGFGGKKKGFKDDRRNKQVEEKRIDKHPPQTQKKAIEVKKQERELELPKPQQVEQKTLEAVKPIPQPIEPISKEQTQGFIPRVIKKKIKR